MGCKLWLLTDEETAEIIARGGGVSAVQEAKKRAYVKAGGIILNPDALEDLYEALEELTDFDEHGGNGKDHYMLMRTAKEVLAKAKVQDVNNQ